MLTQRNTDKNKKDWVVCMMKMTRTKMAAAAVVLSGALALAPFGRAKAQVAQDTLMQKPKTEAAAPAEKPLVRTYPMLSGFSLLPNPAARFRLGSFAYPFVVLAPKSEPAWGWQANLICGSTGVTATAVGKNITASLLKKIGPVVVAAEISSGSGKPTFAVLYTIKHDGKILVSAALMRNMRDGIWTLGGEGRFALGGNWDITPSFKLSASDARKVNEGLGLQVARKGTRASLGGDGRTFNLDVQQVVAIGIGNKTLLMLPDAFVSLGKGGIKEVDVGVTIVL
jgi:hypothetical protein